jgi:hypothetical protein
MLKNGKKKLQGIVRNNMGSKKNKNFGIIYKDFNKNVNLIPFVHKFTYRKRDGTIHTVLGSIKKDNYDSIELGTSKGTIFIEKTNIIQFTNQTLNEFKTEKKKINLGYLLVSTEQIKKDERLAVMNSASANVPNFRLLCDFYDGYTWSIREAWEIIHVHIATCRCDKLYLWDIYSIDKDPSKIRSFLDKCALSEVEIILVNNPHISLKSVKDYYNFIVFFDAIMPSNKYLRSKSYILNYNQEDSEK